MELGYRESTELLGRRPARPARARPGSAAARGRRRRPRALGRPPRGVPRDRPPALLEPQGDEPARQGAQAPPARAAPPPPGGLERAQPARMRAPARRARPLAPRPRPGPGGRDPVPRLGRPHDLLRLPGRALAPPAHEQPGRVGRSPGCGSGPTSPSGCAGATTRSISCSRSSSASRLGWRPLNGGLTAHDPPAARRSIRRRHLPPRPGRASRRPWSGGASGLNRVRETLAIVKRLKVRG